MVWKNEGLQLAVCLQVVLRLRWMDWTVRNTAYNIPQTFQKTGYIRQEGFVPGVDAARILRVEK